MFVAREGCTDSWQAVIADLLKQYGWTQPQLADRIGVSQQTISAWLRGEVKEPSLQTIRRVYEVSGESMLRLISIAYGWPLREIGQRAVLDAALVDEALIPKNRKHLVDQYGILLRDSRSVRGDWEQRGRPPEDDPDGSDDV